MLFTIGQQELWTSCRGHRPLFLFLPHHVACRILVPWGVVEPRPQRWKCQVLTTGLWGNSQGTLLYTTWKLYGLKHLGMTLDMPKQLRKIISLLNQLSLTFHLEQSNLMESHPGRRSLAESQSIGSQSWTRLKTTQWNKDCLFNKRYWNNWISTCSENKSRHGPYTLHKN